ncbi:MAG: ABC transporter ATP-binding protein, partial [SAR324 cluster bacterium]|nr:ABC transporter ATP-binding protein [SAR324 cluster bacterium]
MSTVSLIQLNKNFKEISAVSDFDMFIEDKEFVVLVGPSGCGKSTTLRMIAGLEDITSGTVKIDDRIINNVHPKDRDIAMVFQNYALYPHMNVFKNISFGLRARKYPKNEIELKTRKAAEILDLTELLERLPGELS